MGIKMKKVINLVLIVTLVFTLWIPQLNAQESEVEEIPVPTEILDSLPRELKEILSGKTITKEQYELYLELKEKEKFESVNESQNDAPNGNITIMASSVNPKNCTIDINKNYCFRIDAANSSTKEPYHIHIYQKQTHVYCMRLDNFQPCDQGNNTVDKFDDLPKEVKEGVMGNKKVQERVKVYNPEAQQWADSIPLIKTLAIALIVVALVFTPIPGDEYVAWAYFLRAIAA